jgi:hypothetical protein
MEQTQIFWRGSFADGSDGYALHQAFRTDHRKEEIRQATPKEPPSSVQEAGALQLQHYGCLMHWLGSLSLKRDVHWVLEEAEVTKDWMNPD